MQNQQIAVHKPKSVRSNRVHNLSILDVSTFDRRVGEAIRQLRLPAGTLLESLPEDWQWMIVEYAVDLSVGTVLQVAM